MACRGRGERIDGAHLCAKRREMDRLGRGGTRALRPIGLRRAQPPRALPAVPCDRLWGSLSVFFREKRLSNAIGFDYQGYGDYRKAAEDFVGEIKERYTRRLSDDEDYVLAVILDGENAGGSYRDDGRPFLEALYELLAKDPEIRTVTFREYLEGNAARGVSAHPMEQRRPVHELFTGSWIDEAGSAPGVDLGKRGRKPL